MKVKKTFRLDEKTISDLEKYAKLKKITQTEAIQSAIQSAIHKNSDETDWKTLYFFEKERNDSISEKLIQLSDKVADSLRAEKVNQVLEKAPKALENAEQKSARPWWRFWDAV